MAFQGLRWLLGLALALAPLSPALAEKPRPHPDELPPGLITIDGPGAGVHSPVSEVPAWPDLTATLREDDVRMLDRFYLHAYRFAMDADLHAVNMPEVWHRNSFLYEAMYRQNAPQVSSIVRSALGRAALEEVLHGAVGPDAWYLGPTTSPELIQRRLQPGPDLQVQLRTTGVGAGLTYNVGTFSLGTGYTTETGRLAPVRLSYPFLEQDLWGEVGVDSNGGAWLFLHSEW